jgi:hypothetical protein
MNDQELFATIRRADPLGGALTIADPDDVFARLLVATRGSSDRRARARATRLGGRLLPIAVVITLAVFGAGLAAAASGWLSGQPAPPAVVTNFESYTPQLGFHPNPASAVMVAQDGDVQLYVTTNREGTYCLTITAPWKPATVDDGGTCVPPTAASQHLLAGVVGAAPHEGDSMAFVVAGRVHEPAARTVSFAAPDGTAIVRPVGASGFFIAAVPVRMPPCAGGDWVPTITAADAQGAPLLREKVSLLREAGGGTSCVLQFSQP